MSDKKEVNILPREKLFGEHLIYDSTQISEIEEDENKKKEENKSKSGTGVVSNEPER